MHIPVLKYYGEIGVFCVLTLNFLYHTTLVEVKDTLGLQNFAHHNSYCKRDFLVFGVSSPAPADEKLSFVTGTFVFVFRLLNGNPLVNNLGFPFKGNNSGTHFRNYNVFGARKPC